MVLLLQRCHVSLVILGLIGRPFRRRESDSFDFGGFALQFGFDEHPVRDGPSFGDEGEGDLGIHVFGNLRFSS